MSCQSFRQKFPTAYLELNESPTNTLTIDGKPTGVTSNFCPVSPQLREKLDESFAYAVLNNGLPFNTYQSPNWNPFWTLVFDSAYKVIHREKNIWHVYAHFIWWNYWKMHQKAKVSQRNLFVNRTLFWYPVKINSPCDKLFPHATTCAIIHIMEQERVSSEYEQEHCYRTQPTFSSLSHSSRKRLRFFYGLAERFDSYEKIMHWLDWWRCASCCFCILLCLSWFSFGH